MRGRALQLAGAVTLTSPEDDELIRAEVCPPPDAADSDTADNETSGSETSGGQTVVIRLENEAASGECSCDVFAGGVYCEHIWATLLHVQDADDPALTPLRSELEKRRVRPSRARKRLRSTARPKQAEWISRLSLLRPPTAELEAANLGLSDQLGSIWYVILAELSGRYNALFVELREGAAAIPDLPYLSSGFPVTGLKPVRLGASSLYQLGDPVDRELCAAIVGAIGIADPDADRLPAGDRGHAVYRLAPGARRGLIERMIATGRCVVDPQEGTSRAMWRVRNWQSDNPWRLWTVGEDLTNELEVRVELRRGDQCIGVGEPALLLGGEDGGVFMRNGDAAPLDDGGGAFRWVSQFRTHLGPEGKARSLSVPTRDVGRFLDRLYRLPYLPDLDLPERYGLNEECLEPTPRLEVSNDAAGGADSASSGSGGTLVARLYMEYGEQRINPAAAGRYVALGSEDAALVDDDSEAQTVSVAAPAPGSNPERDDDDAGAENATDHASPQANLPAALPAAALPGAGAGARLVRRQPETERAAAQTLLQMGLSYLPGSAGSDVSTSGGGGASGGTSGGGGGNLFGVPAANLAMVVNRLTKLGWRVTADQRAVIRAGTPAVSVASGIDWFELHGSVTYTRTDGELQQVSLPEILEAIRSGRHMVELGDGSHGLLPEQWLEEHGLLGAIADVQGDHLRFKRNHVALLDALLEETQIVDVDETFAQLRERLHSFAGVEAVDANENFRGSLRQYQREGLGWLEFLRWFGMGGILADDMGLGKTVQVLAMLERYYQDGQNEHRPSLVVAPKSVVFNWLDEAQRFVPEMKIVSYSGPDRHDLRQQFADAHLIVTSYGLIRRDIEQLLEHEFAYAILDEAQAIKNPASQSAKAVNLLKTRQRLALTGTPVENHLGDLWSIFEFLNPGILGTHVRFNELLRTGGHAPPNANGNGNGNGNGASKAARRQSIDQLARMLRPFILRRTKKQVLSDLPEKTEQTVLCDMEPAQQAVYDQLREYYRTTLMGQLDTPGPGSGGKTAGSSGGTSGGGIGSASFMVLEALLRLRQAACHPGLIDPARQDEPSAKLEALFDMLGEVGEEGGKALVFSQFTSMLAIVRRQLDERGIRYCYLDGQTRDRRDVVAQFQNDPDIPVFLISLKAGGFGLNLTAAEYVFILDPWWNPAVESQAIDRAHRIGQTRPVFAYRLVCRDTVEQRILALQAKKRELADAIIDGEQTPLRNLSREDLESLLS